MKKKRMENLIYKSLDSKLSDDEVRELMIWQQESAENRKLYREITGLRQDISATAVTDFKPLFEDRLIGKLKESRYTVQEYNVWENSLMLSFRKIAIAAALLLALLVTYNIQSGNDNTISRIFDEPQNNLEYAFDPVHNIFGSFQ